VVGLEIVAPYTLRVHFDDAPAQTTHFGPVPAGELDAADKQLRV
jgi:hypothetical protein